MPRAPTPPIACARWRCSSYSAADAFAWMPAPTPTSHTGEIVRGEPARFVHLDPTPCPVPPDWSRDGYGSIFTAQHDDL
jgi:ectoine hydroxylase